MGLASADFVQADTFVRIESQTGLPLSGPAMEWLRNRRMLRQLPRRRAAIKIIERPACRPAARVHEYAKIQSTPQ